MFEWEIVIWFHVIVSIFSSSACSTYSNFLNRPIQFFSHSACSLSFAVQGWETVSLEALKETEANYVAFVRHDMYGTMGQGPLPLKEKAILLMFWQNPRKMRASTTTPIFPISEQNDGFDFDPQMYYAQVPFITFFL